MNKIELPVVSVATNNPLKALMFAVIGAVMAFNATTQASEPVLLSAIQMDSVSAGSAELTARVQGTADAVSSTIARSGVRTHVDASREFRDTYRVDTVYASGLSYACCEGGDTTLDINVSSDTEVANKPLG